VRGLKKNIIPPLFLVVITLILAGITPAYAYPSLTLTVKMEKQAYYPKPSETIRIYANLTQDGVPVIDGLVGLQIQDSRDQLIVIRTLTTGTPPPTSGYVILWAIIPCDSSGNPRSNFTRKSLAYFTLKINNYDIEPRDVLTTVILYYQNNIPFGTVSIQTVLPGQTISTFIVSIPIPEDALLGTATAYGNAYTKWPKVGGSPYCKEISTTFEIISGTQTKQEPLTNQFSTTQTTGDYNTTFKILSTWNPGIYTVYVTTRYEAEEVLNSTTFRLLILGDLDKDGDIDYHDGFLFSRAYIEQNNLDADLDDNGIINYQDVFIFRTNYLKYH
jgi:hypothetical protein